MEKVVLEESISRATPNLDGLHILVVEDDEADAHLMERALLSLPKVRHVEFAKDGIEALEVLDRSLVPPDLAFIDLRMPRMDGFRLLIEMACRGDIGFPIIVMTSSRAKIDATRSLFRGADKVLTKPETFEQLQSLLSEAIAAA